MHAASMTGPPKADPVELLRALDEVELVQRAKQDSAAFAELYRRHVGGVQNYLFRRTGDVHLTDDLVSETFLNALRALPGFRLRGIPIRFWLLRIATHAVSNHARGRRPIQIDATSMERFVDVAIQPVVQGPEDDPEQILRALHLLSPLHQSTLSLYYLEELEVREVALVLRCRVGTVKSRLSRARGALRKQLALLAPSAIEHGPAATRRKERS